MTSISELASKAKREAKEAIAEQTKLYRTSFWLGGAQLAMGWGVYAASWRLILASDLGASYKVYGAMLFVVATALTVEGAWLVRKGNELRRHVREGESLLALIEKVGNL